jgi:hypothetical protein
MQSLLRTWDDGELGTFPFPQAKDYHDSDTAQKRCKNPGRSPWKCHPALNRFENMMSPDERGYKNSGTDPNERKEDETAPGKGEGGA